MSENDELTRSAIRYGMAHFPGTGPKNKRCIDCCFFDGSLRETGFCRRYMSLMGKTEVDMTRHYKISGANDSCKYFEQKI